MNEERILDKLDSLDGKTTDILINLARVEEQIRDVPDLRDRVSSLEKWRWTAVGALTASALSLGADLVKGLT